MRIKPAQKKMLFIAKAGLLRQIALVAVFFVVMAGPAAAQMLPEDSLPEQSLDRESGVIDPFLDMSITEAMQNKQTLDAPEIEPSQMKTLFFTLWQHSLLQEAKQLFKTRPPEDSELDDDPDKPRERGVREIALGGIVYKAPENWTVWLNGQRLTPDAIPKEVMDIRVHDKYVELKWFDAYSSLIYPIRLRPHQRFNLDSRIFLPGTGAL